MDILYIVIMVLFILFLVSLFTNVVSQLANTLREGYSTEIPRGVMAPLAADSPYAYAYNKPCMVFFNSPHCGHCVAMKPAWAAFEEANPQRSKAAIVSVDASTKEGTELSILHNIRGLPTVLFLKEGLKSTSLGSRVDYEGDRSLESLKNFYTSNTQ